MKNVVDLTLKKWRQTSFGYDNGNDCLLSLADYLIDCGYEDFGAEYRGTFKNEFGAYKHVLKNKGLIGIVDKTGLPEAFEVIRGNIAVCKFETEIAGLILGHAIAFRSNLGVSEINVKACKIMKMWSVNEKCLT